MNWNLRFIFVAVICLAACEARQNGASANTTRENLKTTVSNNSEFEAGRKIYNFRCYFCHGYSGNAHTLAASYLNPPPADFTSVSRKNLSPGDIVSVLQTGKPGTAMKPFRGILSDLEMNRVALFITEEFVRRKAPNTQYHTRENGWPDHERYRPAFAFATGEIPLDRPWENLSRDEAQGRRLFMSACISCHSRNHSGTSKIVWDARPVSYPRNNYMHKEQKSSSRSVDAMTSASPYLLHEIPPSVSNLSPKEAHGKKVFENNCAFCHGADGTGKNWIGSFLNPHPRNLRDPEFMRTMTRTRLNKVIHEGLPETSMPAWKTVLSERDIEAIVAYISKAFYPIAN